MLSCITERSACGRASNRRPPLLAIGASGCFDNSGSLVTFGYPRCAPCCLPASGSLSSLNWSRALSFPTQLAEGCSSFAIHRTRLPVALNNRCSRTAASAIETMGLGLLGTPSPARERDSHRLTATEPAGSLWRAPAGSGDVDGKRYASADYFKLARVSLFSIARSMLANIPSTHLRAAS